MVYEFTILDLRPGDRPQRWKTTFRLATVLGYALTRQWHTSSRTYRWKWLAKLAARWHTLATPEGFLASAFVEPIGEHSRVVTLDCSSSRIAKAFCPTAVSTAGRVRDRRSDQISPIARMLVRP